MTVLAAWENFYLIVGSSAGALIGLQSVDITLIAKRLAAQCRCYEHISIVMCLGRGLVDWLENLCCAKASSMHPEMLVGYPELCS